MCIKPQLLEEPKTLHPLFVRRQDIDLATRIKIGILVNYFPRRGLVTLLSNHYKVCRPFIYTQKKQVKSALSALEEDENNRLAEKHLLLQANIKQVLSYRIQGGLSIGKISDFLSESGFANSSQGWISETVKYLGDLVGNVILDWHGQVFFASDEIYLIGDCPVLVTVDPVSSAILSITVCSHLNSGLWKAHWSKLDAQNIKPLGVVGDEGRALKSAHLNSHKNLVYQPDTFHAIIQPFGKIKHRLERNALRCIAQEYEREAVYLRAKSEANQAKQKQSYQKAQQATQQALALLSDFNWLYRQIINQLKVVRSDGSIRSKQSAEGEVQAALELMEETLAVDLKQPVKALRKLLPDLFQYLEQAKTVYSFLTKQIPGYILPFYLAYWQYLRKLGNLKKAKDKNRLKKSNQWLIEIMEAYCQAHPKLFEKEKQVVFAAMQTVVQSSAIVECINSILRPIFNNCKGQVSQQTLNLVMYCHNHRIYKRGKRKGKSPIELLTGKKSEVDWKQGIIDLATKNRLLKKVA